MTSEILLEAFGSINDEETRADDSDLEAVLSDALDRIGAIIGGLEQVETITTGMNQDVTYALIDLVDDRDLDIEVNAFYPDVSSIQEEDGGSYQEAWQDGYTWRNNVKFGVGDDNNDPVDLTVRVGDAGNNGQALLEQSRRKGVPALDINMDDHVDKDSAYGSAEDADAEAAA